MSQITPVSLTHYFHPSPNPFSSEFDAVFPVSNQEEIELKPCLQAFQASSQFLLQWKSDAITNENRERLERLCRYLRCSLESESPRLSYIGIALNKDKSLLWIKHMKKLLYKCCLLLEKLKTETHNDSISLALLLNTLVAFTSPNSWTLLKTKQLACLKSGMQLICNNVLGDLIQRGFFLTLRVR